MNSTNLCKCLSIASHPITVFVVLCVGSFLWLPQSVYSQQFMLILLLIVLFFTSLAIILVGIGLKVGFFESFSFASLKDKMSAYLIFGMAYIACIGLTKGIFHYTIFYNLLIMSVFSLLFLSLTTFFWNISQHTFVLGGATAFCLFFIPHWTICQAMAVAILMIFAGVIASVRVKLNAHTLLETCIGFVAGLVVNLMVLFLWK
ncbi:MAG: hypothetical protein LBR36_04160 [Bacteroidales bacterium]|nr:hypothetical protein [Bacteroidales bacterium]